MIDREGEREEDVRLGHNYWFGETGSEMKWRGDDLHQGRLIQPWRCGVLKMYRLSTAWD